MHKKRILIFSLSYFPMVGGAELAVKAITDRISDIDFDLVTLRFNRQHPRREKVGNCNVYRIGGGWGYLSKIFFIPQAAIFASRRQYDTYWTIMTYMLFPVVLLRIFGNRTPYVLTLQDGDPFEHVFARMRIFPFLPLLLYGFRNATRIQAISNFLARWALSMGYKGKVEVIPNGVDISNFQFSVRNFNKENITLITTSRLVEKNGVGDIIEAIKLLQENVRLQVLGTGPLEQSLKLKVKNLKVENRIKFLGYISNDELPKYLSEADIFVRPSLSEGQGISFIEAMASGLPVVATPVGGITDFIKDGETGLFCIPRDPKSIAGQVKRLISSHELGEKLINNARKLVEEKYDWNLIAERMKKEIFDKV